MRLIGQEIITKAVKKHSAARKWVAEWVDTVEDAEWSSIDDVRDEYPSADGVKLNSGTVVTVFNVKGNEFRLLANVNYKDQVVAALDLLTHAEYDKDQWKGRY